MRRSTAWAPHLNLIPGFQTASLDASDGRAHVRRPAAEEWRDVDPAGDGQISAHAAPRRRERDHVTRAHQVSTATSAAARR